MDRDQFLSNVRQAATAGRAYRVHLNDIPDDVGYVGAAQDKCEAFAGEVTAVGGEATIVDTAAAAKEAVAALLTTYEATSALCWQHALLDQLEIKELLATHNVAAHSHAALEHLPADERRRLILAADVGISSVDFAVAETGSLAVCSKPGHERVISLLPPVHIAIVGESQIVPDLFDVFERLGELSFEDLPSNLAFITGPSKTGDIELQLTTGVHGPGKWHVVVIRAA